MKVIVVLEKQSRFTIDFPEEVAKQKYTNAVMGMIQNQSSIKSNFSFTKADSYSVKNTLNKKSGQTWSFKLFRLSRFSIFFFHPRSA